MADSILSRYLDPETLGQIADRHFEPQGLVIGNLAGAHKSPLAGFAVEFAGHREYVPGDDPKHIDWRVYYTREKYFVKQYELETNFVCHFVLDVSASMRYGNGPQQKMLYGARTATTLGYSVVRQSDKASLATFDEKLRGFITPSNSMGQILRMTQHLDQIEPVSKTRIADCLIELTGRIGRREIVFVISDFFGSLDGLEDALQRLRYQRHEIVLLQVLHHDELVFQFNGAVKFMGLEVSDEFLVQPEDLRVAYLKALREHNERLAGIALRNRCEWIPLDTSRNLGESLIDYMNQRNRWMRMR
ncbi:MAG: DUF58 domain-containing protein [Planctomycetes bacterium]|nr:DUF58 domain-containing protein [Planctomycetota bacterium]